MAQIRVYGDIIRGFIEYTGNTIEATNTTSTVTGVGIGSGPPGGLFTPIGNWQTNGSAAFLRGLAGSTVVKAFLAWMGTPVPDVNGTSTNQNRAVTFTTPLGSNTITGNPAWSQQNTQIGGTQFNIRVADVTTIVKAAGTGQYSVVGIPSAYNYAGWTLMVVWANSSFTTRFISIDTYDELVGSGTTAPLQITIGGFITPPTGTVNGRAAMVVGSAENWTISGPTKFGRTVATLVTLSGPNNPATNFFQMQINNANSESATVGQLDTTGTLGTFNPPLNQADIGPNQRFHWDQTNVSINSGLTNSQTSGVFQFGPVNNAYVVHLLSLQIDAQSPTIINTKTVDRSGAEIGDTLTYTVVLTNNGTFSTSNLIFIDTIPSQTTFITGTLTVDGVTQPSASPLPPSGLNVGAMQVGQTRTVTFKVRVTSGINTTATNTAGVNYSYNPATGLTFTGGSTSNEVTTFIAGTPSLVNTKTVSKTAADVGNTLLYTIRVANTGTNTVNNMVLIDTLPNQTSFEVNSLTFNNIPQAGATPFPPTGFIIGTLGIGSVVTITYQVRVSAIPNPNPIPNSANITGKYTVTPNTINDKSIASNSNTVTTQINNASLANPSKRVDKAYAQCGDTLSYTIVIPNVGNTTALNVLLRDTIPTGTSFVTDSVHINDVRQIGANPQTGITVGTIPPNTITTVTFAVIVQC